MKILNKVELDALRSAMSSLCPELFGSSNYEIKIEQTNDKLLITFSECKGQFEDYLKTLDDDIFVEACAQYAKRTGQDLSKVKEITPQLINNFKAIVKLVARMKMDSIKEKYGL